MPVRLRRKGEKNVGWQPETQPKGKPPVEKTKGAETMQRLIDADALITAVLKNAIDYAVLYGDSEMHRLLVQVIAHQPTIDIEPHWIPCSERLPEEPFGCLVTVWDTDPVTMDEFENILPYFVGWDGEQWNDADGEQCPFEVLAWMPLPKPYEVKDEKTD